jgi:hypothetical protein
MECLKIRRQHFGNLSYESIKNFLHPTDAGISKDLFFLSTITGINFIKYNDRKRGGAQWTPETILNHLNSQ